MLVVIGAQVADITGADEWATGVTYPAGDLVKRNGTLNASLADIYADSYTYIHPVTGEEKTVDGMDVLAIVKAVADRRWQLSLPAEPVGPE